MPKRKDLNGIPHNFTKSFFGTERYYSRGYMGDWLSNAATRLNLEEALLDVITATFAPQELNVYPLNIHARELKSIIEKELATNGFAPDFIREAKIKFKFLQPTSIKKEQSIASRIWWIGKVSIMNREKLSKPFLRSILIRSTN